MRPAFRTAHRVALGGEQHPAENERLSGFSDREHQAGRQPVALHRLHGILVGEDAEIAVITLPPHDDQLRDQVLDIGNSFGTG
jgi:hypothetical protein